MITALDASAISPISDQEREGDLALQILIYAAKERPPVIFPIAYLKLAPSSPDASHLEDYLARHDIVCDPISPDAAYFAGSIFKTYRLAGGTRGHLVLGFLIAAQGARISILSALEGDLNFLTDTLKSKERDFFMSEWLRSRNNVEVFGA